MIDMNFYQVTEERKYMSIINDAMAHAIVNHSSIYIYWLIIIREELNRFNIIKVYNLLFENKDY